MEDRAQCLQAHAEVIQGSLDFAWDNGFYVGAWASNVDFEDDADIEVDWYAGYYWELGETVGLVTNVFTTIDDAVAMHGQAQASQ